MWRSTHKSRCATAGCTSHEHKGRPAPRRDRLEYAMDLGESRSDGAILALKLCHTFHAEESPAFDCLVRCFERFQAAVIDLDEFL